MKTLILILFATISYSQNVYVSAEIDVRNAVIGSDATKNKQALNYLLRFGMVGTVPNHITTLEGYIGYERFEAIDFDRSFLGFGVQLYPFKDITVVPSLEPSIISRWDDWGGGLGEELESSHLTLGASLAVRYEVSYHISLEVQSCLLPRIDLNMMYGGDNYRINNSLSVLYRL